MKAQLQYQLQNLKTIDPTSISGLLTLHQPGPDDLRHAPGRHQLHRLHRLRGQQQLQPPLSEESEAVAVGSLLRPSTPATTTGTPRSPPHPRPPSARRPSSRTLDANNAAIQRALLTANSASTGEIQQLQIVNQQLALIHTELANLVQNLSTVGRVVTDYVAASTGEQEMSREREPPAPPELHVSRTARPNV